MTLTAGTVSIADDGTPTKSGLAEAIYDEFVDNFSADVEALTGKANVEIPDGKSGIALKRGYGVQATRIATAIVSYLTANAVVTTTVTIAAGAPSNGLVRDPASPFNDCLGPSTGKTLPGAGTIS